MCVDLSHLNRFVIREKYQSLTPAQTIVDIAASDTKTQPAGRVQKSNFAQNSSQRAPVQHPQTLLPQKPQRSECTSKPPQRLIVDPQWP